MISTCKDCFRFIKKSKVYLSHSGFQWTSFIIFVKDNTHLNSNSADNENNGKEDIDRDHLPIK